MHILYCTVTQASSTTVLITVCHKIKASVQYNPPDIKVKYGLLFGAGRDQYVQSTVITWTNSLSVGRKCVAVPQITLADDACQ